MDLSEIDARVFIVLAFMVIGAIRWVLERVKGKEDQEGDDSPFEDLYEEARKEIVARQHRPHEEQASPPPVQQAQRTPAAPVPQHRAAATPSRDTHAPPPLPNWQKKVTKPSLSAAEKVALARVQQQSGSSKKKQSRSGRSRVRQMLNSPSAARDAIVLSEILGPPKSGAQR